MIKSKNLSAKIFKKIGTKGGKYLCLLIEDSEYNKKFIITQNSHGWEKTDITNLYGCLNGLLEDIKGKA